MAVVGMEDGVDTEEDVGGVEEEVVGEDLGRGGEDGCAKESSLRERDCGLLMSLSEALVTDAHKCFGIRFQPYSQPFSFSSHCTPLSRLLPSPSQ